MILYASRRIVEVVMNLYILPTNSTRWITAKKYKTTSGFQTFFFFHGKNIGYKVLNKLEQLRG